MKLIQQSFEILEQTDFSLIGIKKFIERCGRVCYKSENKITDDSYEKFVNMLVKRDHARPLEFGTVHLKMYISDFHKLRDTLCINNMWNDQWIKYHYAGNLTYVTTNYRYYLAIIKVFPSAEKDFAPQDDELYPKRYTVHFITSRGIMDEFRTHIGLSHLAESSRYCSYDKNRFGNELTFIIPNWVNTNCPNKEQEGPSVASIEWSTAMLDAEASYMNLIKMGCTAQEAREVLPLSVKSELISCGFEDAWSNFFYRRCAKDAHPMAREIATKVRDKFNEFKNETKESK